MLPETFGQNVPKVVFPRLSDLPGKNFPVVHNRRNEVRTVRRGTPSPEQLSSLRRNHSIQTENGRIDRDRTQPGGDGKTDLRAHKPTPLNGWLSGPLSAAPRNLPDKLVSVRRLRELSSTPVVVMYAVFCFLPSPHTHTQALGRRGVPRTGATSVSISQGELIRRN